MSENIMNVERDNSELNREGEEVNSHDGSSDISEHDGLEFAVDNSIPDRSDQTHTQDSSPFDTPHLKFNSQGNFVLNPAGGPTFETPRGNQFDARLGGGATAGRQPDLPLPPIPPVPERQPGTGGGRFGGFRGRLAAGLAVLGLLGAGGAVYGATLGGGEDGGSDKGVALNGDYTATSHPNETATPKDTATPTEVPPSKRLPYKLTENIYGSVGVGVSDGVQKAVECDLRPGKTIICPGLAELYLDEQVDPKGEKLEQFNNKVKWLTWKDRNPDTTLSYNEFIEKLNDPNESFIVTARGFEGSSSLPTEIKVDLKKKIHYVQVPFPGANLYTLDINWKGNIRVLDGELYLEMADFGQGGIADEKQHPEIGIYPAKNEISINMVRIASIFIDSKSQQARNILVERMGAIVGLIETLKPEVLQGEQDGIVKARPIN